MIEPGTRLADRYRLEEPVTETGGAVLWKATDETLARAVAVWTFAPDFPRTREVVHAARSASRVPDARLTQVFDADDSGPNAYVVEEWVVGKSLTTLLSQGPLESDRAAGLVAEAAEALAAANTAGIYHLCLSPDKLLWSAGGAVKLTGMGVDAAIRGLHPPQNGASPNGTAPPPETVDAMGVGRLFYAALTGHWPGPGPAGLPTAPTLSGLPCEPSRLQTGIPEQFNEVVCRAVLQEANRNGPPLRTTSEIADALSHVPRLMPLPEAAAPAASNQPRGTSRSSGPLEAAPAVPAPPPLRGGRSTRSTSSVNHMLIGAVAMLVLVAVVVGAWSLGTTWDNYESNPAGGEEEPQEGEDGEDIELLTPAGVQDFDPGGDGEHGNRAGNAIDGDPSTQWNTQGYASAQFGNLKEGVGLAIDMGEPVEVHELDLLLGNNGAVDFELRIGDEVALGSFSTIHTETGASGEVPVKLEDPAEGRYILLWFTELAPDGSQFRAIVHDVELRGNM